MLTDEQVRASFVRQRRNLIVVSILLLVVESTQVVMLNNNLKVFDVSFRIVHPELPVFALRIMYAYWLWRYIVFFNATGEKGLDRQFRLKEYELTRKLIQNDIDNEPQSQSPGIRYRVDNITRWQKDSWIKWRVTVSLSTFANGQIVGVQGQEERIVSGFRLPFNTFRTLLYVLFLQPHFSEYMVPLLVALPTLGYELYRGFCWLFS